MQKKLESILPSDIKTVDSLSKLTSDHLPIVGGQSISFNIMAKEGPLGFDLNIGIINKISDTALPLATKRLDQINEKSLQDYVRIYYGAVNSYEALSRLMLSELKNQLNNSSDYEEESNKKIEKALQDYQVQLGVLKQANTLIENSESEFHKLDLSSFPSVQEKKTRDDLKKSEPEVMQTFREAEKETFNIMYQRRVRNIASSLSSYLTQGNNINVIALQEADEYAVNSILKSLGGNWKATARTPGQGRAGEVVTLYNADELTLEPTKSISAPGAEQCATGYRIDFFKTRSHSEIAYANTHLCFDATSQKTLLKESLIAITHAMGNTSGVILGDLNHQLPPFQVGAALVPPFFRSRSNVTYRLSDAILDYTPGIGLSMQPQTALAIIDNQMVPVIVKVPEPSEKEQQCYPEKNLDNEFNLTSNSILLRPDHVDFSLELIKNQAKKQFESYKNPQRSTGVHSFFKKWSRTFSDEDVNKMEEDLFKVLDKKRIGHAFVTIQHQLNYIANTKGADVNGGNSALYRRIKDLKENLAATYPGHKVLFDIMNKAFENIGAADPSLYKQGISAQKKLMAILDESNSEDAVSSHIQKLIADTESPLLIRAALEEINEAIKSPLGYGI